MVRLFAYLFMMSLVAVAQTRQPETLVAKWQHEHGQVPCGDSPIPGRRPQNWDCAVLVRRQFSSMPPGAVSLRFETFPTRDAAEVAATPASVEVEAGQKVWLLTIGPKGERSEGGVFVTEVGPISIPAAPSYEMFVAEADLGSEINGLPIEHTHSGPEIWYLLTGEQCVELPDRVVRAKAGEGAFAPADTPMMLNIMGKSKRDALFVIIHDSARPWNTYVNWHPQGLCNQ